MTPHTLQLLVLAAVTAGAGIVLRRFSWREYPALISWMLWEVFFQAATLGDRSLPQAFMLVQDGICAAAICEVIRDSRLSLALGFQVRFAICALAGAKILASIPELTTIQSAYLFRSYALWAAFGTLTALTAYRWQHPALERRPTKPYRIGLTLWVLVLAVSGSFVRGGIGYKVLPRTMATWSAVHAFACIGVATVAVVMSLCMARTVRGRKHAAKTPKGATVCGLIETERAA